MGLETGEISKSIASSGSFISPEPFLGKKPVTTKSLLPFPIETEIKYFVGLMSDESDKAAVDSLMTKSFRCAGILKESGDICVISETGTFDKQGDYHIVIKYAELPTAQKAQ